MTLTIDHEDLLRAVQTALSNDTLIDSHDAYVKAMAQTGEVGAALAAMRQPIASAVVVSVIGYNDRKPKRVEAEETRR